MVEFPELALGTYEEFILGFKPKFLDQKGRMALTQSFASHSHQASIRCVAAHGRYLLSAGADEYINVYDMLLKKVLTTINFHNSTVTCLEFVSDGSHFVSANQNGDIAIFSCNDWNLVKYWKQAHKFANGVISISVHPSGSLLMTSGSDNTLRFWNLIKGRQAYAINVSKKCSPGTSLNLTKWSRSGTYYALCIGKLVEIYDTESAAVILSTECPTKICSIDFSVADYMLLGLDTGVVQIHNLRKKKVVYERQCHTTRVKCIAAFAGPSQNRADQNKMLNYVATADSSGVIKLWRLRIRKSACKMILRAVVDIDCRITCLTTVTCELKQEP